MISAPTRTSSNDLAKLLWAWFAVGGLLLVAFPPLRQHHPIWGWLPFWCVVAPLIDLAFVQRDGLLATGKALGIRFRHRRRARQQAVDLNRHNSRWGMRQRTRRSSRNQHRR